ncbi:hypothetical protein QTP88_023816 [Uroleucon formosanum]
MPIRSLAKGKRAVHWWSEEIADLRRAAITARRSYQRAGRRSNASNRNEEFQVYNRSRKVLRIAIRKEQERSWRELCDSVDSDPQGVPYRLVTKRLGRRHPVIEEPALSSIARELFPALPTINWDLVPLERSVPTEIIEHPETSTPLFTADELRQAVRKLPSGKAPGPDNIPNEIIKLAAERSPEMFLETFNACLTNSQFPNRWKCAKLILLHKGAYKPPDQPSSYRPISLLDGGGKLLERLLLNRLEAHIERAGALSGLQFGFRRHRSTTDAIEEVIKAAREAGRGAVQNRHLCAVVTLDVKNAFNTAPRKMIDESLQRSSVPEYLIRILRTIRYLGVQLDTRMTFVEHFNTVAAGARKAAVAIERLMPNVGGPSQSKRSLLMSVVHSRLLYGAAVWADRIQGVKNAED